PVWARTAAAIRDSPITSGRKVRRFHKLLIATAGPRWQAAGLWDKIPILSPMSGWESYATRLALDSRITQLLAWSELSTATCFSRAFRTFDAVNVGTIRHVSRHARFALASAAGSRTPEGPPAPGRSARRPRGDLERLRHAAQYLGRRAALRAPAAVRHGRGPGQDGPGIQDVGLDVPQAGAAGRIFGHTLSA